MINWGRVRELRHDVGAEDFDEIVEIFFSEVGEITSSLQASEDDQELELHLHALKNAALNLGFCDLAELCQTSERLAASKQGKSVDERAILKLLDASLQQFKAELLQHFEI